MDVLGYCGHEFNDDFRRYGLALAHSVDLQPPQEEVTLGISSGLRVRLGTTSIAVELAGMYRLLLTLICLATPLVSCGQQSDDLDSSNAGVSVFSPNGGEGYFPGDTVLVNWFGGFENTGVDLRKNGVKVMDIAGDVNTDTLIQWVVPGALPPGGDYQVRVYDAGPLEGNDWSDGFFAVFPEGGEYCGQGTEWDASLNQCVSTVDSSAVACGDGTVWDPFNQECIVAIPADIDHDGCVTINDLLALLSVHGTCPAVPFADPCADENTLLYDGHAYDLISIGDQCWFAENLRSAHYANGDAIPSDIQDSLLWATEGAQTYFLEDSVFLEERGRMYNGFAVLDARGLCPAGWHVPSDTDFIQLEEATGLSEVDLESTAGDRGCNLEIGGAWKSQSGWYPGEQGTDLWGLSVKPSGYFLTWEGFGNAYTNSEFWTSTPHDATRLWRRQVPADSGCLFRGWWKMGVGSAIRCVKD